MAKLEALRVHTTKGAIRGFDGLYPHNLTRVSKTHLGKKLLDVLVRNSLDYFGQNTPLNMGGTIPGWVGVLNYLKRKKASRLLAYPFLLHEYDVPIYLTLNAMASPPVTGFLLAVTAS